MGRRYIYNKKKRVRKSRSNKIVLELENDKRLTLGSTSINKNQADDHDGLSKKFYNHDNKLLVDLEEPLVLNVNKKSVLIECTKDKADKQPCKSAPCQNRVKKIRIEPLRKKPLVQQTMITKPLMQRTMVTKPLVQQTMVAKPLEQKTVVIKPLVQQTLVAQPLIQQTMVAQPLLQQTMNSMVTDPLAQQIMVTKPLVQQAIVTKPSNNLVIKNNPTFILVSKTSIDDIEKKPINLTSDIKLRQISFKSFEAKMLNSQTNKNTLDTRVQDKPTLPISSSSNSIVCIKPSSNILQAARTFPYVSTLHKIEPLSSLNSIMSTQNSNVKPSSYGSIKILDKVLQGSNNVQHESVIQKLTSASTVNGIMFPKKSNNKSLTYGNFLKQDNKSVNIVQESTLNKSVLNGIPHENSEIVYPVALKANNLEESGTLQIFSNESVSEDEMQILGI